MNIKLWKNFSKRKNSTKQPIDAEATILDVKLKENCSVESPSFILSNSDFDYNYAYAFGHYYYIDNITMLTNQNIQIDCSQDLLATYKSDIQTTSAYVSYSSSGYSEYIHDPRCISKTLPSVIEVSAEMTNLSDTGCYILNIVNDNPGNTGFTSAYLMDYARVVQLANYLNSTITDDVLAWLQAVCLKPYDSIVSIIWLPVSYSTVAQYCGTENVEIVRLGKAPVTQVSQTFKIDKTQPIPISSVIASIDWPYTDFRKGSPFTQVKLVLPYYGDININPFDIIGTLQVDLYVDPMTGEATYKITSNNNGEIKYISTINFVMGATCPLGQTINQASGAVTGIAGTVAGAITAGVATGGAATVIGAITAIASAINTGVSLSSVTNSVKGSVAGRSFIGLGNSIRLLITTYDTIDPANMTTLKGRPVMQVKTLNTLSGYIECVDASINIDGLGKDKEAINTYLNGGIYLE